jgi:hypothetical protein
MKIQPLTQTDKDTILAMARTLASRSVSAGGAQTAQPATQAPGQGLQDVIPPFSDL